MKKLVAQAWRMAPRNHLAQYIHRFASTEGWSAREVAASYGGTSPTSDQVGRLPISGRIFAIAERASIPAEVWRLKTAYRANWGKMPQVLSESRQRERGST
jgi:dihydroorotase/N-acyl-D-amino-acid deacylase